MSLKKYDVIITGGGLAGLTLALQLKRALHGISILVLEKRKENAPEAIHKVGESFSELGAHYMRDVLDLKEYLTSCQLPKFGFRFFFSPEYANDITKRVEVGSKIFNPFPSHQVDRGQLENDLILKLKDLETEILLGAKVTDIELSKAGHIIKYVNESSEYTVESKWFIDSTGRNGLLKRKLGLEKELDHEINSAWFRLDAEIDIDFWSDNLEWRQFVDPGRRRLATNHLMGKGYWVWVIPLISGRTSIGIVADPRYHPFHEFNNFEKAMLWLEKYEPLAANILSQHTKKLMDFKVMKNFAYDCKQFYSSNRWAVTGEAGAFLDALYSPGTDFIALSNSWITDLVKRDINNEDITLPALIYDFAHKELLRGWLMLYRNMYGLFGNTQGMLMKIVWDWASYWAIPNVLFASNGYTNFSILKQYSSSDNSIGRRFAKLNENMQHLFRSWAQYDSENSTGYQLNVFDLNCLYKFQSEIGCVYSIEDLMSKIESNLKILEQISAEIFRKVSTHIHGTPEDMKVNPYTMLIDDEVSELIKKSKSRDAIEVIAPIKADIEKMWLQKTTTTNEHI